MFVCVYDVVVCTACLWGAMPLAIAAFTSVQPLSVNKLEPELRGVYICLFEMKSE